MKKFKTVDAFFAGAELWSVELARLREIVLACGLDETLKWGGPCYTHDGVNVVGLGGFKSYFGLWFFQGALLQDSANVLVNAQPGKTRALRQWRMTCARDIRPALIKRYVKEAVALARDGKAVPVRTGRALVVPTPLQQALAQHKTAADTFASLRPGQQREYAEYIAEAKRADTKQRRIDKILPMIAAGIGLNDKYRGAG